MKQIALDRFRKARQSRVSAGKFTFIVQRPTMLDVVKAGSGESQVSIEFAARFVVGWEGVDEADLIPGGDPEPVEFDPALFAAWIAERSDLWLQIAEGVAAAYRDHEEQKEARGNV